MEPRWDGELFVMRYDCTHVEQLTDNQWDVARPRGSRRAQTHGGPGGAP